MKESRPYYVAIPNDISGRLDHHIFLWVMHGSGRECIVKLEIDKIPAHQSTAWLKSRIVRERFVFCLSAIATRLMQFFVHLIEVTVSRLVGTPISISNSVEYA